MKKLFLTAMALTLAALMAFGVYGCGKGNNGNGGNGGTVVEDPNFVVINDFESDRDVMLLGYQNSFGKVSVNTDKDYITSGGGSARFEIWGEPSMGPTYYPTLNIYTDAPYSARPKTDFTDIDELHFDVFNASERDIEMSFGFFSETESPLNNRSYSPRTLLTLKQGQWTNFRQAFLREYYALNYDLTKVTQFVFVFNNRKTAETPAVIYLDSFRAHKAETAAGTFNRARECTENSLEILNFNDANDWQLSKVGFIFFRYQGNPMPSVARAASGGKVYEGTGSLKIVGKPFGPNPYNDAVIDAPVIEFDEGVMNAVRDMSDYNKISMMWYNDWYQNVGLGVYVTASNPDTVTGLPASFAKFVTISVGAWTKVEVTKQELVNAGLDVENIINIKFAWPGFSNGVEPNFTSHPDLVLYLDDLKYEK
ncbi:MAG: hypothetical protein FWE62_00350 [Firmicutes bacterium]|nr:hypothetical protein [Bacillota bacterium]